MIQITEGEFDCLRQIARAYAGELHLNVVDLVRQFKGPESLIRKLEQRPNIYYVIYKSNHPSNSHARYDDKADAIAEVERLEALRLGKNKQIDESPATGHGAAFANVKDNEPWSFKELTV